MADGKVVIETDLDSSGIEKGLSKIGGLAVKGLSVATGAITGTATALGGVSIAAIKAGSDFESQMSRVQAISGATGSEFNKLKEQAIQLGADTAFSSSQAAEGMENLAAAGFTTSEIMDAMPGLLDLAAASGEDLASSSDIAASTLRGFGLEAADAAHVADVLAANANKTNSSVADTGEAMKYVAPLARAAGLSMEETAAAIGIMANAGIQGSQAGTTLRGAISRLSKPTKQMSECMADLGISFYDSEGNMKSLAEQTRMMEEATAGMTDEQRNNVLVTLYGQEALSGMLALMNEGDGALLELTHAYETCDGSAKAAAETMQDNLAGAMDQLGGSAETLGIVFYESVSESLKETAKSATDSINNITEAFRNGGLDDAIEAAGDEFANLAVEAASHAPDMVDTAVDFIESFVDGIGKNKKKLVGAAVDMAKTLGGGLADLLPEELNDVLSKGASVWKTASAAVDAYNVVQMACTAQGVISNATLTTGQAVVGLLTGKISLATAAQTAWNAVMNANPIGLLVTAIGALVAGLGVYKLATDESKESQYALTDAQEKAIEKTHEEYEAYKELDNARKEAMDNVEAEYGYLSQLNDELMGLVDSNGQVKAGYEDRANFIVNQLAQAFNLEEDEVWDIIGANSTLANSIDELIEKKKAEAMLNANQEAYEEAIRKQNEALIDYTNSLSEYESAQKKYNEAKEAAKKVEEDYQLILKNSPEAANGYLMANQDILTAAEDAGEAFQESKSRLEDAEKAYVGYNATIQNYEGLSSAILSGESEKIEDAMLRIKNGFITAETGTKESLENQVKNMQSNYEAMQKAVEDGTPGVTQQMVDSAKQMVDSAKVELDKLQPQAEESTKKAGEKAKQGLESQKPAIDATSKEIADSSNEKLGSADTKGTGSKKASEYDTGVKSQKGNIDATSKNIADSSNQKLGSADTKGTGSRKTGEYNAGVGSQKGNIDATSKGIADSSDMMLGSANTSGTGQRKGGEYNLGIASQSRAVLSTAVELSNTADSGMGSADTRRTGIGQGNQFATGVGSTSRDANAQGQKISRSANDGAGTYDGSGPGSDFGSGFVGGISSWLGEAARAAADLALSAWNSLRQALDEHSPSRKAKLSGKNFDLGFSGGILENKDHAVGAAEEVAFATMEALNMDDISRRMQETLALNKNRVAKSFRLEFGNSFLNQQNFEQTFRLSDQDIEKLARRIGERTGEEVADNMEGMSMKVSGREFSRMVREVRP